MMSIRLMLGMVLVHCSAQAVSLSDLNIGFDRSEDSRPFSDIRDRFPYRPAYLVKAGEDRYFALSRDERGVAEYRLSDPGSVSGWPLTRWEGEYVEDEILQLYGGNLKKKYTMTQDAWADIQGGAFGCLHNRPLRYGDFTGDGDSEVVVISSDIRAIDLFVFSPSRGEVIFSSRLSVLDSIPSDDLPGEYGRPSYQHVSYLDLMQGERMGAGLHVFGKIFLGDFSESGEYGLIQWRKLYRSLPLAASEEGFFLARESLRYYRIKNGIYIPQEIDEATVRRWLINNDLTWQSGFPAYSECPGEERQLIPEMHAPLLNDSDVLQ